MRMTVSGLLIITVECVAIAGRGSARPAESHSCGRVVLLNTVPIIEVSLRDPIGMTTKWKGLSEL